jgi:hypothetical protein
VLTQVLRCIAWAVALPTFHVLCWNLQGEGNGYFVDRVQRAIADELDVPIADFTLQQKHKLHRQ